MRAMWSVVVVASLLTAATGCSRPGHAGSPRLVFPGADGFSMTKKWNGDTTPTVFGSVPLCLSKTGAVTITRLEPRGGAGLRVTGFATRPDPQVSAGSSKPHAMLGGSQRSLDQEGFHPGAALVDAVCTEQSARPDGAVHFYELAAQFIRTSPTGTMTSVRVHYRRSGGGAGTLVIPWEVVLCGPADDSRPGCE